METEVLLKSIKDGMRRKGCAVSYDSNKKFLIFIGPGRGVIRINDAGAFVFHRHLCGGEEVIEFNHDEDPIDKFIILYDFVCEDMREDNKIIFNIVLVSTLIHVILWAFVFRDIHPISIVFWSMPLVAISIKYCREYFKVIIFKMIGRLCLTLLL